MVRRVRLVLATVAALGGVARPALATPCDGRVDEVRDGGVVVVERPATDSRGVAIEACGRLPFPPSDVWPVVMRCEHFAAFLPSVDESRLLRRTGESSECETRVDLPFPLDDLHSITFNRETVLDSGGYFRQWHLVRGNYARNNGSWTVLPWPNDPASTLLVYNVDIDPDNFVPDFILRRLQSGTAPQVFTAVRERVGFCNGAEAATCAPATPNERTTRP